MVYLPNNSLLGLRLRIYFKMVIPEDFCLGDKIPADCTDDEFGTLAEEMLMLNGYAFFIFGIRSGAKALDGRRQ